MTQEQADGKDSYPDWLLHQVQGIAPHLNGRYAAQLLWQRGFRDPDQIAGFLDSDLYEPTSPFAFGSEIEKAIARLQQARDQGEIVTIWGDFDADGVTATAVLWEGLGQFFTKEALNYWIPNRLTESHGLNCPGILALHQQGTRLIVTCDTGCTHHREIEYARTLGIDVIVTDHHTLSPQPPSAVAILNPQNLDASHPLATLSGVAVAYKLVEAWYLTDSHLPQQPLEELLDLVAIGLIADLVALRGDCRYLAQRGIARLQMRLKDETARPGVTQLLKLCQRSGNRPTDISFGLGPRINAVSRICGDARLCVELLTSRDPIRCRELAQETELANGRRKELQQRIKKEAIAEVERLDLSTTSVIVAAKPHWPVGILGLVAGGLAQHYQRPTFLFQVDSGRGSAEPMARGSARSVRGINLYQLMAEQAHLCTRFGGHPLAAGLSLPTKQLGLLTQALNHSLRLLNIDPEPSELRPYDLNVTVQELGRDLFKELQLLEPYGMGNPVPKLLIKNAYFDTVTHRNLKDSTGKKLRYIQASFLLKDESCPQGFPGIWWERYKDDIPKERCNVFVELDFNNTTREPELRVIEAQRIETVSRAELICDRLEVLDYRKIGRVDTHCPPNALVLQECPRNWDELGRWVQRSRVSRTPLVLAYPQTTYPDAVHTWQQLMGMVQTAMKTGNVISRSQIQAQLYLSKQSLGQGLNALMAMGLTIQHLENSLLLFKGNLSASSQSAAIGPVQRFLARVDEERYQTRYFQTLPVEAIKSFRTDR